MLTQKILFIKIRNFAVITINLLMLCSSCKSSIDERENSHEISTYKQKIKGFDCSKLANEITYLNKNLSLMNEQIKNSSFDTFMEIFISIGIYHSGKGDLKERIMFFEQKREILSINQKERFCNE